MPMKGRHHHALCRMRAQWSGLEASTVGDRSKWYHLDPENTQGAYNWYHLYLREVPPQEFHLALQQLVSSRKKRSLS